MADLDEIMSGREDASVQTEAPAVEQSTEERARDENGRFAANQQQQEDQQVQPAETQTEQRPPEGFVPIQALDARLAKERERHDAAMRQQSEQFQQMLQHFQQPPRQPEAPQPPPDWWENPDAAVEHRLEQRLSPLQQQEHQRATRLNRLEARMEHGEAAIEAENAFNAAVRAGQIDPREHQRIQGSENPFAEAVIWHKQQAASQKYGADPEAYINAEIERRLAERQSPTQQTQPQQQLVMPSSFAGARNAGSSSPPAFTGPRPLSEIMHGR